jgi:hypothetical protein
MDQWLTIFIGAVVIGIIVLIIGAGYTSANSSKLPQNGEMVQLFLAGSVIGGVISWVLSSGYFHGSTLVTMLKSDLNSSLKDIGLKGGEETIPSEGISGMVGGFLKSIGATPEALQEMTVGMPTF